MKKILISILFLLLISSCSINNNEELNNKIFKLEQEKQELINKNIELRNQSEKKDLTKVINSLYPKIILDYQGLTEERIIQDFGQPNSKLEATGFLDGTLWSNEHFYYNYSFDNGNISFYINKKTKVSDYVHIFVNKSSGIEILVPGLINKGSSYSDIILGKSTFSDIFKLVNLDRKEIKNIESYEGGSLGNSYTNIEFYFGNYGRYHEFIFSISGLYNKNIEEDYTIVKDKVLTELLIK